MHGKEGQEVRLVMEQTIEEVWQAISQEGAV